MDVVSSFVARWTFRDTLEVEGDIKGRDCLVRYRRGGKVLAAASIFRDVDNLKEEAAMERSPDTANSRPMITITIHAGTR